MERLDRVEVERLIESAYGHSSQYGFMVKMLFYKGARVSDFVQLRVEDLHLALDLPQVYIGKAKGGSDGYVPILPALAQELRTHLSGPAERLPLREQPRGQVHHAIRSEVDQGRAAQRAGIDKNVTPHRLRASVATILLDAGKFLRYKRIAKLAHKGHAPLEQIQLSLGHASVQTTERYLGLEQDLAGERIRSANAAAAILTAPPGAGQGRAGRMGFCYVVGNHVRSKSQPEVIAGRVHQLFAQVPGPRRVRGPEGAVLEGEEKRVFFFGQAKAKPIKWKRLIGRALLSKTGRTIMSLAQQHGVSYTPTANDTWARDATRLADDDVVLDDIELLLIALQRTGHLSRPEALRLQVDYLREARL